jgi:hypothetical protein
MDASKAAPTPHCAGEHPALRHSDTWFATSDCDVQLESVMHEKYLPRHSDDAHHDGVGVGVEALLEYSDGAVDGVTEESLPCVVGGL